MNSIRSRLDEWSDPPAEGVPWTVLHLVAWSASHLKGKGVGGARLDAEHLLAHALGVDRLRLYLDFDRPVTPDELSLFKPLLQERAARKPLQYVLGRACFRELDLMVDPRVLIPRPETEELVGAVLERVGDWRTGELRALDVGTGSGAIALSLAREGSFGLVVATDSSPEALEVARENARFHDLEAKVELRCGESLNPVSSGERFHVLVSNPPYVAEEDIEGLEPEVRDWEPRTALVADEGGLSVLSELVKEAPRVLETGGLLALEVGAGQALSIAERVRDTPGFDSPVVLRDLGGVERLVLAIWRGPGTDLSPRDRLVASQFV